MSPNVSAISRQKGGPITFKTTDHVNYGTIAYNSHTKLFRNGDIRLPRYRVLVHCL